MKIVSPDQFEAERTKLIRVQEMNRPDPSSVDSADREAIIGNLQFASKLVDLGRFALHMSAYPFPKVALPASHRNIPHTKDELCVHLKLPAQKYHYNAAERLRRAIAEFFNPLHPYPTIWITMGQKYFPGNDTMTYECVLPVWSGHFFDMYADVLSQKDVVDTLRAFYGYPPHMQD